MLQETLTRGHPAKRWQDYVVPQCWEAFGETDHDVWDLLFARQVDLLGDKVVRPFLDGLEFLRLSKRGVPDLELLNERLEPRTGWRTVAVPGLVPDAIFFAMLSERIFPIGNFIRTRDQLDYLEEPDLFHDIFGHVPMLSHPAFAAMMQHAGRIGAAAVAAGRGELMARIYWHSVEFGLATEAGELKILGAGLASSFGEARFSLDSKTVERVPFSAARAMRTPYRHDMFQPLYMVAASVDAAVAEILGLSPEQLLAGGPERVRKALRRSLTSPLPDAKRRQSKSGRQLWRNRSTLADSRRGIRVRPSRRHSRRRRICWCCGCGR